VTFTLAHPSAIVCGQTAGMAGRPSKLTAQCRDDLTLMLAHGVPVGVAAKSVGVSARTLRRWLAEGDLRERIAEIRSARRTGDGAASEARLERRWPERWGAARIQA
jgi:hypothetical protein